MSEEIKGNTTSKLLDLTVLLGFIGALSLYVVQPISDGDLWWHIVSGRWILAQGSIPTSDQWNITGAGKLWRAYSWSNEIVYAWVHDHLGRDFLICLLISLSILFTCAVGSLLFRLAGSSFFAAFLTLFVVAGCTDHFALRPQTLTYVLFATVIYLADRLHCKGNNYNYLELLLITGIFSLWSNTHLTAVFGVIALLLWSWRLDALDLAQLKSSIRSRGLIVPLACALFGTFLTPYFGAEWSVLAHKTNHPFIYNEINEFKPANIMKYSVAALILLIVFMQVLILQDKQRVAMQPGRLLCTLFFILLGLSITKFMPYALIATVALLADCWKEQRQRSTGKLNQAFSLLEENCVKYFRYLPTKLLIITIFLICISERLLILSKNAFDLRSYPVNASNFLLEKNLPAPLLNSFNEGGYLMYRYMDAQARPRRLVSIDGRTNVGDQSVLKAFQSAWAGNYRWREYINLINPQTIIWPTRYPLTSILFAGQEWCRVYHDEDRDQGFSVFVRREYFLSGQSKLQSDNCV